MTFTADIPGAIVVPAHESNVLRAVNHPKVLVLHTPEETADQYEGTPAYFQTPNIGASTQYYADNDGDLYQMVPEQNGALANGVIGKPYPAGTDPSISLNYQSLSMEIEGRANTITQTLTAAQRATVVSWIADCARRYGIPLDRAHVIGHYEVSKDRSDPGALDIQALIDEAIALGQEDEMTPEERELLHLMARAITYTDPEFKADYGATKTYDDEVIQEIFRRLREYVPHYGSVTGRQYSIDGGGPYTP